MFFGAVVTLTDLLPPRLRYGYVHRITRALFSHPLPALDRSVSRTVPRGEAVSVRAPDITCAILADHLDVGGIGSVIEMLATHFASAGVRAVVICQGDGERAARLRALGIDVHSVTDTATARDALAASGAAVVQLHSAPEYLERAAMATGLPLVTVMHNTEIHYTTSKWTSLRALLERSEAGVAVSATVAEYHARRVTPQLAERITVVPNGAPALAPATVEDRVQARASLAETLGATLDRDVLFVCLARYDSQKNIAGATAAFARAAEQRDDIQLVFAGDPSDWAELRRAEAVRDAIEGPRRIHFLGNSDAVTLLTAGDAFLLDSFFEGWPVAATEAAAAGLPLLLSEMGGARELVTRDPEFSIMVPNPAGDAAGISDRLVRIARRHTRSQVGAPALEAAVLAIAAKVTEAARPLPPRAAPGVADMLHAHAAVLREVVRNGPSAAA